MTEAAPAPSHFVEGTNIQYALDSTSLSYFKQCPRLYQYIMIEGYAEPGESIHLRFGQELHSAIENYHRSRAADIPHDDAVHDVVREVLHSTYDWDPDITSKAGKLKNRASLIRTTINYLDHYRNDNAKTVVMSNGVPAVELSFRFELGYGPTPEQPYLLCGHLDRVVDFNGGVFVLDTKTSSSTLGDYYFKQYDPHNQMSLYSLGGRVILDSPIRGVIIDGVQMLADSNAFQRGFTFRTEDQLSEWQENLAFHLQVMKAYAEADFWPMNDTACGMYGGCRFREVCSKSPSVREVYLKKFEKKEPDQRWNPLRSR